ncbi:DNA methyltransferase [Pediococcus acidilactici]|nr:DNA methyltransferase [Pediococcus acidilactici]
MLKSRSFFHKSFFRTCLVSAESGRIVENRLRSLSCQIIQAIFLERNLR